MRHSLYVIWTVIVYCFVVQPRKLKLGAVVSVVSGDHVPVPVLVLAAPAGDPSTSTPTLTLTQHGVRGVLEDVTPAGVRMEALDTYMDMCTTQGHATITTILTVVCVTFSNTFVIMYKVGQKQVSLMIFAIALSTASQFS